MPLPQGVALRGKKYRAKVKRKNVVVCGPSRGTVAEAKKDLARLRKGQPCTAPRRALPRYVQKVKPRLGFSAGFRAQRKLQKKLVQGPWRVTLAQAAADADQFAAATNAEQLLQNASKLE